jgi:hypothetical protein
MAETRLYVTNSSDQPVDATPERIVDAVNAGHYRTEHLLQDGEPVSGFIIDIGARFTRQVGEQPEPAPVSVVGCPYCQRVPCEAPVAHGNWRRGVSGSDV